MSSSGRRHQKGKKRSRADTSDRGGTRKTNSQKKKKQETPGQKSEKRANPNHRGGRRRQQQSRPPRPNSVKCDALKALNLPESLFQVLKSSWVEPLTAEELKQKEEQAKQEMVKLVTAPLHETGLDRVVPVKQRGLFFYKFPNELSFPERPFHGAPGDRLWHEIKEDLEDLYGIKKKRQQKRNLDFGAFIAYRLEDWQKIKRRQDIFEKAEHAPITSHEKIRPNEKLVIACFPQNHVSHIYKEVKVLRFEEDVGEEERLSQVLGFNAMRAPEKWELKGRPPIGYRCHNCNSTNHYRHNCDKARRMAPKGIPKRFLEKEEVGDQEIAYALEDGTTVKVKHNDDEFKQRFKTAMTQSNSSE